MNDAFGNELKEGDKVVYTTSYDNCVIHHRAKVVSFTPKKVRIVKEMKFSGGYENLTVIPERLIKVDSLESSF